MKLPSAGLLPFSPRKAHGRLEDTGKYLLGNMAAVGGKGVTRHEPEGVRAQPDGGLGDLFRLAQESYRVQLGELTVSLWVSARLYPPLYQSLVSRSNQGTARSLGCPAPNN